MVPLTNMMGGIAPPTNIMGGNAPPTNIMGGIAPPTNIMGDKAHLKNVVRGIAPPSNIIIPPPMDMMGGMVTTAATSGMAAVHGTSASTLAQALNYKPSRADSEDLESLWPSQLSGITN